MKLCPQCAFLYEDVQTFCDMDGNKLVPDSSPVVSESSSSPSRLTIDLKAKPSFKRSTALAIVGGLVLAVLFAGIYLTQRIWRSQPSMTVPPARVVSLETSPPAISANATGDVQAAAQVSPEEATATNSASSQPESGQTRDAGQSSRLRSISSGGLNGNSKNPVLLRLTNGATIKADEAWERKDGVWYRQGGVITFLKRSQVRAIERPNAIVPAKSGTSAANPRNQIASTQTQPRPVKTQIVTVKKESKVTSLIKRTGRILKKPFRF